MPKVLHPHITSDPIVCGGSPCIAGTRFSVRVVVSYVLRLGLTPEELQADFPHLLIRPSNSAYCVPPLHPGGYKGEGNSR